ncbi:MAG: DNA-binding protein [Desulfobacterium sp.]|nr:DNA-binding protein [Desulfobacterium sp.]
MKNARPETPPDRKTIMSSLTRYKTKMKLSLKVCAHCGLCAESCFIYVTRGKKPEYMPSHKMIHSIGKLYKKKGKVTWETLEEIKEIAWKKCVLCTRCYCPLGIDIPEMISLARSICRSQNVLPDFDECNEK